MNVQSSDMFQFTYYHNSLGRVMVWKPETVCMAHTLITDTHILTHTK